MNNKPQQKHLQYYIPSSEQAPDDPEIIPCPHRACKARTGYRYTASLTPERQQQTTVFPLFQQPIDGGILAETATTFEVKADNEGKYVIPPTTISVRRYTVATFDLFIVPFGLRRVA